MATHLTALTSCKVSFHWSSAADEAFKTLKSRFTSAPILQVPDPDRQFMVEVDASDVGVGAVLSQRSAVDQKLHPCAFFSLCLSPAERNYDIGNRELLAVKLALEEWWYWLEGTKEPFMVWTDHKNLEYLRTTDALSRQFQKGEDPNKEPVTILPPSCVIATLTWDIKERVRIATEGQPGPSACPANCLYVPETLRSEVLQWAHPPKFNCHPGSQRTRDFLLQCFLWPILEDDTRDFVKACSISNHNKTSRQAPAGLLQPFLIPHKPWSHISLDFVTGLPSSKGNTVILTVVNCLSKMAHFVPLRKLQSAKETAQLVLLYVFCLHGLPVDVVSDRIPVCLSLLERVLQPNGTHCQPFLRVPPPVQWAD